ncbi:MAG: NACHT domain-containing protein [Armatimonadetes bacterium]|nr:NACHT domain-containing protein [Armatimonadota bacterium]MDW8122111.1 ATPase domain-containing protein [Armatimonadota bacterium]
MDGQREETGIKGLDLVLGGGFLKGATVLVQGLPGSGKTTLGLQFIYHGASRKNQRALIVSFEEFPTQMFRDAKNFGWDFEELVAAQKVRIIATSPQAFYQQVRDPSGELSRQLMEGQFQRLLIDSLSHFQRLTSDPVELREILSGLLNRLRQSQVTALMTQEVRWSESEVSLEQYAVDAVVQLFFEAVNKVHRRRFLEVLKARGQIFQSGRHTLEIGKEGIEVYPVPTWTKEPIPAPMNRIPTGVPGLDAMLGGGFFEGFSILVVGETGSGKSTMARQFVAKALQAGETALYISFREGTLKILQTARTIGLELEEAVADGRLIIFFEGLDSDPYRLFWTVKDLLEARQQEGRPIRRAAVDSLSDLLSNLPDPSFASQYLQAFARLFSFHGVTSLFTLGYTVANGVQQIPIDSDLARVVDCILNLRYTLLQDHLRKTLTVVKMRGTEHDTGVRPVRIGDGEGMIVQTGFEGMPSFIRKLQQLAEEQMAESSGS